MPEHYAGLHRRDGFAADRRARPAQLDAIEPGRPLEQRLAADAEAGRYGAAQVVAILADGVEDGSRAEVDDDERRPVLLDRRHGVGHAVGAHLARAVVEDSQSRPYAGAHHQRLHVEVPFADALEYRLQVGHDAADDGGVDVDTAVIG